MFTCFMLNAAFANAGFHDARQDQPSSSARLRCLVSNACQTQSLAVWCQPSDDNLAPDHSYPFLLHYAAGQPTTGPLYTNCMRYLLDFAPSPSPTFPATPLSLLFSFPSPCLHSFVASWRLYPSSQLHRRTRAEERSRSITN